MKKTRKGMMIGIKIPKLKQLQRYQKENLIQYLNKKRKRVER